MSDCDYSHITYSERPNVYIKRAFHMASLWQAMTAHVQTCIQLMQRRKCTVGVAESVISVFHWQVHLEYCRKQREKGVDTKVRKEERDSKKLLHCYAYVIIAKYYRRTL